MRTTMKSNQNNWIYPVTITKPEEKTIQSIKKCNKKFTIKTHYLQCKIYIYCLEEIRHILKTTSEHFQSEHIVIFNMCEEDKRLNQLNFTKYNLFPCTKFSLAGCWRILMQFPNIFESGEQKRRILFPVLSLCNKILSFLMIFESLNYNAQRKWKLLLWDLFVLKIITTPG